MTKRILAFTLRLARVYFSRQVPRAAAQMSYYLLFSLFPLLLILVAALGFFRLDVGAVLEVIHDLSPVAEEVLGDYITYVAGNRAPGLMAGGLAMAITASSAAFRALMRLTGEAAGRPAFQGIALFAVSVGMSALLLVIIFVLLLATVTGRWFLALLSRWMHMAAVAWLWQWLRFPVVFALGVLALTALYRVSLSKRALPGSRAWPGAVLASVGLVTGTGLFSMFISMSSRYSLVYGSLANIILLMLWLFVCSNILLSGNLVNCLLAEDFTKP